MGAQNLGNQKEKPMNETYIAWQRNDGLVGVCVAKCPTCWKLACTCATADMPHPHDPSFHYIGEFTDLQAAADAALAAPHAIRPSLLESRVNHWPLFHP